MINLEKNTALRFDVIPHIGAESPPVMDSVIKKI